MRNWINLVESAVMYDHILFHVTPSENVPSIMANGFRRMTQGMWGDSYETPRTFFMQDNTDAILIAGEIFQFGVMEVSVLEIDTTGLNVTFHPDDDYFGQNDNFEHPAVWTDDFVPASAVKRVIEKITPDDL